MNSLPRFRFPLPRLLSLALFGLFGPLLPAQNGYETWRNAWFEAADRQNPALSGPSAQLTSDRVPNLHKYALGISPFQPAPADTRQVFLAEKEARFSFLWPDYTVEVIPSVEYSLDLESWQSAPQLRTETAGGVTVNRIHGAEAGDEHTFPLYFRLNLTLPSPDDWPEGIENLVISEFMASNQHGLRDLFDDTSDWIEIFNKGEQTVNLEGLYLTDDRRNRVKWRFPAVELPANTHLLVFASSRDQRNPEKELHANFQLNAGGEYLGLVAPDGATILHHYDPAYPPQFPNLSYGLTTSKSTAEASGTAGEQRPVFLFEPTPRAPNGDGEPSVTAQPVIETREGIHEENVTVSILAGEPDSALHYTLDGRLPDADSPVLEGSLSLDRSALLKVRAMAPGKVPSPPVSASYLVVESDFAGRDSNLPIVIIDLLGVEIPGSYGDEELAPVVSAWIDREGSAARATVLSPADYFGEGGLRKRGSSSSGFPKPDYAFESRDRYRDDKATALFGMAPESDWVLRGSYIDRTLLRDALVFELSNAIGQYAPKTQFIELFINMDGDRVGEDDYEGVYTLIEKIKRDPGRVDITKVTPADDSEPNITGGYIFRKDRRDPGEPGFDTLAVQCDDNIWRPCMSFLEPEEDEVTAAQRKWVEDYFFEMETILDSNRFDDPETGFRHYIDEESWLAQHLLQDLVKEVDGMNFSSYFYKPRNGKIIKGPIWDMDRAMGNSNQSTVARPNGFWMRGGPANYPWYHEMFDDPAFHGAYLDLYSELRDSYFTEGYLHALIDQMAAEIGESADRNFERWPILNEAVEVSPNAYPTYEGHLDHLKWWLSQRLDWLDGRWR